MEIKVMRNCRKYVAVSVKIDQTTVDLGLFNDEERDDLARILVDAAYEMGPSSMSNMNECNEWFGGLLQKCGIDLPPNQESSS